MLQFNQKLTGKTENNDTKNVDVIVPLKCLSKFWRALQMSLINCEINFILPWSVNYVLSNTNANQATFADTLYE